MGPARRLASKLPNFHVFGSTSIRKYNHMARVGVGSLLTSDVGDN
jgi:hypothetical protein